jgi:hypothetical protein
VLSNFVIQAYMTVLADDWGPCTGCTTTIQRDVTYQIMNFSGTVTGTIPIGESATDTGWNCTQSFPTVRSTLCSEGVTADAGEFTDGWSMFSDAYTPAGCGFNVADEWEWCASSPARGVGKLTGYIHTNAVSINGVVSPPNKFASGTIINP